MTELFDAVSRRLNTIFTAHAAMELEAEMIVRHAKRKAALLSQAAKLEEDGFKDLAEELRQRTSGLDPRRPAEATLSLLTQACETPTAHADGTAIDPTPDTPTLPEAAPTDPTPDASSGRNGRKKNR